jgi:hypothetical protein
MLQWCRGRRDVGFAFALLIAGCGATSSNEDERAAFGGSAGEPAGRGGSTGGAAVGDSGAAGDDGATEGGAKPGGEGGNDASGGTPALTGGREGGGGAGVGSGGGAGMDVAGGSGGGLDQLPELVPCDSGDASGCDAGAFCVDQIDTCLPELEPGCTGYCASRLPVRACEGNDGATPCPAGYECVPRPSTAGENAGSTCVENPPQCESDEDCPTGFACVQKDGSGLCAPERVNCSGPVLCPAIAAPCLAGFVRATPDDCFGPCIRVEHCTCESDAQCLTAPAVCDPSSGTCALPKAPAPRCLVPFEPTETCGNPARAWFAFLEGRCQEVTSERCGQPNEFLSLEECQTHCEGVPTESPCAEGFAHATVCIACGVVGGCSQTAETCARTCVANEECSLGASCFDGICQVVGCT